MFKRFWYKLNNMAKPETKFWKQIKANLTSFRWVRLESWASQGVPDLLGATPDGVFFTVELKATKSNRINISPHQIAFHKSRKKSPSFFLVKSLVHGQSKKFQIYLVPSSLVDLLVNDGLVAFSPLVDWDDLVTKLDQLVA